jgi:hypothetical protein
LAAHHCLVLQAQRSLNPPPKETNVNAKIRAETVDQDERELMDPDSWDWDNVSEGRTMGTPGAILRVRFSREELRVIERIARDAASARWNWFARRCSTGSHLSFRVSRSVRTNAWTQWTREEFSWRPVAMERSSATNRCKNPSVMRSGR